MILLGTTFGGNPFICSVANKTFDIISEPEFLNQVRERGSQLYSGLQSIASKPSSLIKAIRTSLNKSGLLIGVDLKCPTAEIISQAKDAGLMIITAGPNTLRFAPPLIISSEQIDTALSVLEPILVKS